MDELNDLESLCLLVEDYKVALEEAERTISFMNNKISLIEKEKEDSNDQHEQIIKVRFQQLVYVPHILSRSLKKRLFSSTSS